MYESGIEKHGRGFCTSTRLSSIVRTVLSPQQKSLHGDNFQRCPERSFTKNGPAANQARWNALFKSLYSSVEIPKSPFHGHAVDLQTYNSFHSSSPFPPSNPSARFRDTHASASPSPLGVLSAPPPFIVRKQRSTSESLREQNRILKELLVAERKTREPESDQHAVAASIDTELNRRLQSEQSALPHLQRVIAANDTESLEADSPLSYRIASPSVWPWAEYNNTVGSTYDSQTYPDPPSLISDTGPSSDISLDCRITCSRCSIPFSGEYARGNLHRHMKTSHSKEKFTCEVEGCSRQYQRSDARLAHYRKIHPGLEIPPSIARG
ncbi:hypothetical protein P280DRAFT_280126 [Massarina eburnea CBS 473.64]|uniref:C2H2-type domain-containing protein n=1 Tax=Massarina eburnea CBS 473.64 TaxID=1395130 RepID=A0A6A6RGV8_9PLEO|nr:hypothetical protein P280DRAFT_280126 [Massarina eburnea CBS 473.64]